MIRRILLVIGLLGIASSVNAMIVLDYVGEPFTSIDAGTGFVTTDFVTGTVTFDAVGDAAATAATFTVTTSGTGIASSSFTITADISELNCFCAWTGSDLTGFNFTVTENVVEGISSETIVVSDFGDSAGIDETVVDEFSHAASNFDEGTFTPVPEPSAGLFLSLVGVICVGWSRARKSISNARQ